MIGRSKVYIGKMESYVSYRSESVVKAIRGGDRLRDPAFYFALLYMLKYHSVD